MRFTTHGGKRVAVEYLTWDGTEYKVDSISHNFRWYLQLYLVEPEVGLFLDALSKNCVCLMSS